MVSVTIILQQLCLLSSPATSLLWVRGKEWNLCNLKIWLIYLINFSSEYPVFSVHSSVVEVLAADKRRKGRPTKPDRPSASENKFPCEFCEKRYGTKQSLQVKLNKIVLNGLCSICLSGSCFYKAPSWEESPAKPSNGNLWLILSIIVWFILEIDIDA